MKARRSAALQRQARRQTSKGSARFVFMGGAGLIVAAEAAAAFVSPGLGLLLHGLVLLLLLALAAATGGTADRNALTALALLPVMRILSLTVPIPGVSQIWWYLAISLLLLAAVAVLGRRGEGSWPRLAWPPPAWQKEVGFALSGLPLAFVAFKIAAPPPLLNLPAPPLVAVAAALVFVFAGAIEEICFRGLLQGAAVGHFGKTRGLALTAALFAAAYLGSLSLPFIVLAAVVGLLFGAWVERTGSVWGAALAHGLLSLTALLILPLTRL